MTHLFSLEIYYNYVNSSNLFYINTGPRGAQGGTGPTGAQGATAAQGAQGATGSTGPTGAQGAQGATGSGTSTADQIFEGNTKAEVIDTGSDGKFVVTTEGSEGFSINSNGSFKFNRSSDSEIIAPGNITIDYKMSSSLKIRNFTQTYGYYFYPMSDTYPVVVGSYFSSNPIKFELLVLFL